MLHYTSIYFGVSNNTAHNLNLKKIALWGLHFDLQILCQTTYQ